VSVGVPAGVAVTTTVTVTSLVQATSQSTIAEARMATRRVRIMN
jgi:hypothetical protein